MALAGLALLATPVGLVGLALCGGAGVYAASNTDSAGPRIQAGWARAKAATGAALARAQKYNAEQQPFTKLKARAAASLVSAQRVARAVKAESSGEAAKSAEEAIRGDKGGGAGGGGSGSGSGGGEKLDHGLTEGERRAAVVTGQAVREAARGARAAGEAGLSAAKAAGEAGATVAKAAGMAVAGGVVGTGYGLVKGAEAVMRFEEEHHYLQDAAIQSVAFVMDRPDESYLRSQRGWCHLELEGTGEWGGRRQGSFLVALVVVVAGGASSS